MNFMLFVVDGMVYHGIDRDKKIFDRFFQPKGMEPSLNLSLSDDPN
jgi:hypothetical protein